MIAVLGAGAWGGALALQLVRAGHPVCLWTHNAAMAEQAIVSGMMPHLNPIVIPPSLTVTTNFAGCVQSAEGVLISVPSHAFDQTLRALQVYHQAHQPVAWATKGFTGADHRLLHQLVRVQLPDASATVLSGPTFAAEVAKGLPTAMVAASEQLAAAEWWASRLHTASFRVYTNTDVTGVEIGGAVKNVMAIAAGVSDGLGFGANARAALISRALAEIMRLGLAMGAQAETFMGLTGLGDLVLTCTDNQSRNRRFGLALAQGDAVLSAQQAIGTVEGIAAAHSVVELAHYYRLEMPIVQSVVAVLSGQLTPKQAFLQLMTRAPKAE
jgi:glycerol-3-phosphate dehydrogenase (NAD(P)+)